MFKAEGLGYLLTKLVNHKCNTIKNQKTMLSQGDRAMLQ